MKIELKTPCACVTAIILLLFVGNLSYISAITPCHISLDAASYLSMTEGFYQGSLGKLSIYPPGYPLFLLPFYSSSSLNARGIQLAQNIILWLSCLLLVYALVAVGLRPATSAFLSSLSFSQVSVVAAANTVGTEALTIFLSTALTTTIVGVLKRQEKASQHLFLLGLLASLLALVRPQYYFVAPSLFLAGLCCIRLSRKHLLLFCIFPLLLQGGWLVRNVITVGVLTPSTNNICGYLKYIVGCFPEQVSFPGEPDKTNTAFGKMGSPLERERFVLGLMQERGIPFGDPATVKGQLAFLKGAFKSGLATKRGFGRYVTQVRFNARRLLGTSSGYWEGPLNISTFRHYRAYYLIFEDFWQGLADKINQTLFPLTGCLLALISLFPRRCSLHNAASPFMFLWLMLGSNVLISSVFEIPTQARYNVGVLPLYTLLYFGLAHVLTENATNAATIRRARV